jgi:hypothetical protein
VGYDDGSFIELDAIEGARREARTRLEAPNQAAFRLVIISRADPAGIKSRRLFLSDKFETIRELPGPLDYDPRERPWYKDASRRDGTLADRTVRVLRGPARRVTPFGWLWNRAETASLQATCSWTRRRNF